MSGAPLVIRFVLDGWTNDPKTIPYTLGPLLESLTLINCAYLARNPRTPSIYQAGIRYQRERKGQEDWRNIPAIFRHGGGDCEDLACARTAEYRVLHGLPARPIVTAQFVPQWCDKGGKPLHPDPATSAQLASRLPASDVMAPHWLYHIKVGIGSYREDPSLILGMGKNELENNFPEIP